VGRFARLAAVVDRLTFFAGTGANCTQKFLSTSSAPSSNTSPMPGQYIFSL
jgi:hypothetical protein